LKLFEALNKVTNVEKRIDQLNSRSDQMMNELRQMQINKVD